MTTYEYLRAPRAAVRPDLVRREPRILAGVCQGLAAHLGGPVRAWRIGFALAALVGGLGALVYAALATSVPREGSLPAARAPLARDLASAQAEVRDRREGDRRPLLLVALILGLMAAAIAATVSGAADGSGVVLPVLVVLAGAGIAWSHPVGGDGAPVWLAVAGVAVAAAGALGLAGTLWGSQTVVNGIAVSLLVSATLAAVLLPVIWHNRARLEEEREARIRESERADIAAHLHDSVLQTLALIRSRAQDPDEVAALARAQERDLRWYLYSSRPEEGESVASQLRRTAIDVEELFRAEVETVTTGDVAPSAATTALLGATREALTNACKHGGGKVSLFAQLSESGSEVFVRDRGPGFDEAAIDPSRAGIRDSIRARLAQVGGRAEIRSPLPSGGTEVHLSV